MITYSVSSIDTACLDTSHKTQVTSEEDDDLMPPLELCIKTWLVSYTLQYLLHWFLNSS